MKLSNVIAGASAAIVAFQAAACVLKGETDLLRPPGAQSEEDFLSRCVKCGKCIEACPYRSLSPASQGAGVAVGTPCIDAREQACRLRDIDGRQDVRMGIAVIDEDLCIAFQGMRCEVCYRACPLIDEAIVIDYRMREGDAIHSVFAPAIVQDACVGCGLCVERCVVGEPRTAIRIMCDAERARAANGGS